MMIDNLEKIKKLLVHPSPRVYYLLMILRRRKDPGNSDMPEESHRVYMKFISHINRIDLLKPEIETICKSLGARCYVDLNPRDSKVFATELIKKLAGRLGEDNYEGLYRLQYQVGSSETTISPKLAGLEGRKWMFDVDSTKGYQDLVRWMEEHQISPIETFPTTSGYHVIIKAFNIKEHGVSFEKEFLPGVTLKPGCLVLAYK